jgi:uncharacterized protein (TIGR02246 family)
MKRLLSSVILVLISSFGLQAQTAPDAGELTKLLNEFLAGASRNDAAIHDRFWAEDVIYTGSAGRRRGKADIMRDVRSAAAPKPGDSSIVFSAEEIRIQQYGDTAIVAFRLVATPATEGTAEVTKYLNSGTFLKRKGQWQIVNWQSTRMPPEESSAKEVPIATLSDQPSMTLPPELARVLTDYEIGWKAGNPSTLSNLFAEDGFVLAEGRPATKGRAAIQKLYTHPGAPLSLRAIAYAVHGDVGYIIGGYSSAPGKADDGKFTLTLRKGEDGRWLIVSDMDNANGRQR